MKQDTTTFRTFYFYIPFAVTQKEKAELLTNAIIRSAKVMSKDFARHLAKKNQPVPAVNLFDTLVLDIQRKRATIHYTMEFCNEWIRTIAKTSKAFWTLQLMDTMHTFINQEEKQKYKSWDLLLENLNKYEADLEAPEEKTSKDK